VAIYANMHQSKSKFINGQPIPQTQQKLDSICKQHKNSTNKEQQHKQYYISYVYAEFVMSELQ